MTWGTGPWGAGSPWGTGSGVAAAPPTLTAVTSDPGPLAPRSGPATVAIRGGTICRVVGSSFFASAAAPFVLIELLTGSVGSYDLAGLGYVFDPEFDVTSSRIIFGAPALEAGLYHLRVTTEGGSSGVLEDVIAARLFSEEYKTVSVRGKFSPKWDSGSRILRG